MVLIGPALRKTQNCVLGIYNYDRSWDLGGVGGPLHYSVSPVLLIWDCFGFGMGSREPGIGTRAGKS